MFHAPYLQHAVESWIPRIVASFPNQSEKLRDVARHSIFFEGM
jgi:hypothetical protein